MNTEFTESHRAHGDGVARMRRAAIVWLALFFLLAASIGAQQKKSPPAQPLDLNAASVQELQTLPEVGPSLAKSIVRFREKSGPFRRVEDLLAIRGMSKRRLEKIRPYVFVKS